MQPGPAYVKRLAELIDSIQANLTSLKQHQRTAYAELVSEQHALEESVALIADEVDSWAVKAPELRPSTYQPGSGAHPFK